MSPLSPIVRCAMCRLGPHGPTGVSFADHEDRIVFLVELTNRRQAQPLTVDLALELWRGDRLRDRLRRAVTLAPGQRWSEALALRWGASSWASPRLTGRAVI